MSACEWNPVTNAPAFDDDPPHGQAVWSVGAGDRNIHLCETCAALPRFKRLRKRTRLKAPSDLGLFTPETSPALREFATAWLKAGDGTWKATTELLGLQWGDIDLKGRFIHVRRTRVEGRLTSTKSKLARRVDMSLQLTETLQRLRTERKRAALASGEPMPTWVFLTPDGHAVDGDNLRRRVFHRLLETAKLRQIRVHDLRHTYASLLIQQGESLRRQRESCKARISQQ